MSSVKIVVAVVAIAGLLYLAGRYFSLRDITTRRPISIDKILKGLPEHIDHQLAEDVIRMIAKSYGLDAGLLRLDDSFAKLAEIDSWALGKGEDELGKWLVSKGVSFERPPLTVVDLVALASPQILMRNGKKPNSEDSKTDV